LAIFFVGLVFHLVATGSIWKRANTSRMNRVSLIDRRNVPSISARTLSQLHEIFFAEEVLPVVVLEAMAGRVEVEERARSIVTGDQRIVRQILDVDAREPNVRCG
jgi:hypothetical protein